MGMSYQRPSASLGRSSRGCGELWQNCRRSTKVIVFRCWTFHPVVCHTSKVCRRSLHHERQFIAAKICGRCLSFQARTQMTFRMWASERARHSMILLRISWLQVIWYSIITVLISLKQLKLHNSCLISNGAIVFLVLPQLRTFTILMTCLVQHAASTHVLHRC